MSDSLIKRLDAAIEFPAPNHELLSLCRDRIKHLEAENEKLRDELFKHTKAASASWREADDFINRIARSNDG